MVIISLLHGDSNGLVLERPAVARDDLRGHCEGIGVASIGVTLVVEQRK